MPPNRGSLLSRLVAELWPPPLADEHVEPGDEDDVQLELRFDATPPANATTRAVGLLAPAPVPPPAGRWRDYAAVFPASHHQISGTVRVLDGVASPELDHDRHLLVYLPPSYATSNRRYPVLYMHDGQNLFDPATAFAGSWEVDATMEELARGKGHEAIVVAIPNSPERLAEYSPFRDRRHGGGRGDAYLRYVADTLKPLIDHELRTLPSPRSTGTLGSSMGGLISLYALFARPDVFGFAGAMSPSLFFAHQAIYSYVTHRGKVPGKLYLDVGSHEGFRRLISRATRGMWPSDAVRRARRMVWLLERLGWTRGRDLLYVEEARGRHHEAAWARRLPRALGFLLRGTGAKTGRPAG